MVGMGGGWTVSYLAGPTSPHPSPIVEFACAYDFCDCLQRRTTVQTLHKKEHGMTKGKGKILEPINASVVTCAIGFFFIAIGDIDFVAQIISMFFMVTYGAICLISFLEHFAADPSYRPKFKSRWYFSLLGAVLCFYLMFKMNTFYAWLSIIME